MRLVMLAALAALAVAGAGPRVEAADFLVVDPANPSWLRYSSGAPFFMCGPGDPEGFLYRGSRNDDGTRSGDQEALIERLAATGANSIYLMAVRSHGGDGGADENPFRDPRDPSSGLEPRILEQWEQWFDAMDRAGIVIFFILYDDGTDPFRPASLWERFVAKLFGRPDEIGDEERAFVEAIVGRFRHHRNLIWVVAEEYSEALGVGRASEIASIIRDTDGNGHAVAVHQTPGVEFDFADDPAVDQFAIQYGDDATEPAEYHRAVARAWELARGRYNLNMSEVPFGGVGLGEDARRKIWAMAMGGAYVMVNGWDVETTPEARLHECGHMVELMNLAGVHRLSPATDLAAGSTEYVLAGDGAYVLYTSLPEGDLGLARAAPGEYELSWLDVRTGERRETSARVSADGGAVRWSRPPGVGPELAVYVRPASDR
jgi:hypothetical protein